MTNDYQQFPISDYLSCNLLKDADIQNLKSDSKMLSIGVGIGLYEEYLINKLNVPPSSLYCADLDLHKKWIGQRGFQFDIRGLWPNLNIKFDYILFGQVIGVSANNGRPVPFEVMTNHVVHIVHQAKIHLKENGKILIYDTTLPTAISDQVADARPVFLVVAEELGGNIVRADGFGSQVEISF